MHEHLYMPEDHMDELYHSRNPLVRFAHQNRLKWISRAIPKKDNQKILDAGCGEGHLLEYIQAANPSHELVGYDITDVAIESARRRCPTARIERMDLVKIESPDESFDVIICTEVLEHIYEYREVLGELLRVLKKGGALILTFPNEFNWTVSRLLLGRNPIKVPDHVNSFTPQRLVALVGTPPRYKRGLPFNFPFLVALGYLMKFEKLHKD